MNDTDKRQLPLIAVRLEELGFKLWATEGTASVLRRYGIESNIVDKISTRVDTDPEAPVEVHHAAGSVGKNVVQLIEEGKIDMILNTTDHNAYIKGYPDRTVRPDGRITRAEVATILDRLMKDQVKARFDSKPTVNFSDVSSGAWYYDAVQMCAKAGIVAGYPDGSFKPNQAVTRAEFFKMVAMLYSDTLNTPITGGIFKDINGHWAEKYINLLQKLGIVKGDNGSARPNDNLTRGETAAVMNRILGRVVNNSSFSDAKVAAAMKTWPDCTSSHWAYAEIQEATNSHDYTWDINILTYSDHNGIFKAFIENLKNPVTERWTYIKK